MNSVMVSVEYSIGHTVFYTYKKSEYFCPVCGKQSVYEEQGDGDYYVGVDYICSSCSTVFNMPICRKADFEKVSNYDAQTIKAIRESEGI